MPAAGRIIISSSTFQNTKNYLVGVQKWCLTCFPNVFKPFLTQTQKTNHCITIAVMFFLEIIWCKKRLAVVCNLYIHVGAYNYGFESHSQKFPKYWLCFVQYCLINMRSWPPKIELGDGRMNHLGISSVDIHLVSTSVTSRLFSYSYCSLCVVLQADTTRIIYAYGRSDPKDNEFSALNYHGRTKGVKSIYLLDPVLVPQKLPNDITNFDIRVDNVRIELPRVHCTLTMVTI